MPFVNPKDPLIKAGPCTEHELFAQFAKVAAGFPRDIVVGAALNVIVNALRQQFRTRDAVETAFNEMFGRAKALLLDHYDVLGRKRGVFPFHQIIEAARVNGKKH